jgi:chitin synthase
VFLTESAWALLENKLRATEKREQRRARCIAKGIPFGKRKSIPVWIKTIINTVFSLNHS